MLVRFRNPRAGDVPQLLRAARKYGFDREDVLLPLSYSRRHCFVMEAGGRLVGANLYIKINKELAYWSFGFVDPAHASLDSELAESSSLDLARLGVKRLLAAVTKSDFKRLSEVGWAKAGELKGKTLITKEVGKIK